MSNTEGNPEGRRKGRDFCVQLHQIKLFSARCQACKRVCFTRELDRLICLKPHPDKGWSSCGSFCVQANLFWAKSTQKGSPRSCLLSLPSPKEQSQFGKAEESSSGLAALLAATGRGGSLCWGFPQSWSDLTSYWMWFLLAWRDCSSSLGPI